MSLGTDYWWGRTDEFEPKSDTAGAQQGRGHRRARCDGQGLSVLDAASSTRPTSTRPSAAMAGVLSEYIPQLAYGKFDDPAAAVAEMRQKLKDVGYEDARASIQADMDAWKAARGL